MSFRRTESRVPLASRLQTWEAIVSADGRCALVSFVTSPIVVNRSNVYVLFVTDAALAASAASYEWSFSLDGRAADVQTTPHGEISYSPGAAPPAQP